ncbi:histone H1.4-like [Hemicordylus capensis]|uniref:histone H1.4-like n=1 Tax=Hemicordylus capensis TaxID=884348 RepID=UPI00230388E5|nr:histone H1.4-like [Hemicordylus capensis]XP_053158950.1 histone H1.4-like [Hemicordylus capensis]XP_053158951.1 histone H1.4-like [Hemicordylus capensis]
MEGNGATVPRGEMAGPVVMIPTATQISVPRRKVLRQRKEGVTNSTEGSGLSIRPTQKKKSLIPCKSVESLPSLSSLSGLLVQAIASCESDNGLSFTELKKVLSGKGYDVSRHCPIIKRKLHSLASKGALMRMTHGDGSTFFVVRKYQENTVTTTGIFEGSEKTVGIKKAESGRRKTMHTSGKTKRAARQAKSSGWKAGKARRKLQRRVRKLKAGEKQHRQRSISKSSATKRLESLAKKAILSSPGTKAMSKPKRSYHSIDKAGATLKRPRNPRSRAAPAAKKPKSPISKAIPNKLRCLASTSNFRASLKASESPYSKAAFIMKKPRYRATKTVSPGKRQRSPRRKNAHYPQRQQKSIRGRGASIMKRPKWR